MNSSQALGLLRREVTTGLYSSGPRPYCDRMSAISAASTSGTVSISSCSRCSSRL
uniref:Uncharacterized protein n=1 Tax=Arundo donax TaxID=35708 RepID=A0A0A9AJY1_ARUDO